MQYVALFSLFKRRTPGDEHILRSISQTNACKIIQKLYWASLEQRRQRADFTLMYKVVDCLVAGPMSYHPTVAQFRSTMSHIKKFIPYQTRINLCRNSCFPRTVITWNLIQECVMVSTSMGAFNTNIQLLPAIKF